MDGLVAREDGKQKVILPVWHHVNKEYVAKFSPILADKLAALTEDGFATVVQKIWEGMSLEPTRFETMVNLEAERRLLKFSLVQLKESLDGYVEAHKSFRGGEPQDDEVYEARKLLELERTVDGMNIEMISNYLDQVRESIEAVRELWSIISEEMEWEGTHH